MDLKFLKLNQWVSVLNEEVIFVNTFVQVSSDGADGCQSLSGDSDGSRP